MSSGQGCPAPPRKTAGFTLLEVIVATALMGIAVVGLLSLVSQSLGNAARVRQYDRAAMLAKTQMDALLTAEPLPVGERLSGEFDAISGWEAMVEPWEIPGGAPVGSSMLARVSLEVWWQADGQRKTVSLDGYRRMRIRER